jgi:hypothetical protein
VTDTELEDLEAGLTSPFWAWLQASVQKEWGAEGYAEKVSRVVQEPDQTLALDKLRQLAVLRDQARWFLSLPSERVNVIKGVADTHEQSIAEKVIALKQQDVMMRGQSRRGRL